MSKARLCHRRPRADFKVSAARRDGKNGLQTAKAKYTCKKKTCLNGALETCENGSLMALRAVSRS